jgi:hypothetical protein
VGSLCRTQFLDSAFASPSPTSAAVAPATRTLLIPRADQGEARQHNFVVAVRIRPLPEHGQDRQGGNVSKSRQLQGDPPGGSPWAVGDVESNCIRDLLAGEQWCFDHVFGPECFTSEIFAACVQEVICAFSEGINSTIFAYGQTASGKTHTMYGDGKIHGIVPKSVAALFGIIGAGPSSRRYEMRQ